MRTDRQANLQSEDIMLLSVEQKKESMAFVKKFAERGTMMIKSTVKLEAGALKASGVILNTTNNAVEILTAAHNLLVWKGLRLPPDNWTNLCNEFAAALIIHYNPKDSIFNGAPTQATMKGQDTQVVVPNVKNGCDGKGKACYYDLALITCTNADLLTFARGVLGQNYDLTTVAKFTVDSTRAKKFLDKSLYVLLQLGYGKVSDARAPQTVVKDTKNKLVIEKKPAVPEHSGPPANEMGDYNLQYRMTVPLNPQYVCVYDQIADDKKPPAYCENCNAIQLKGTKISSSAEGDSGGPIYAINYTKLVTKDPDHPNDRKKDKVTLYFDEAATLIGLTTGSDMTTSQEPPGDPYSNDIATSVIPYLETRKDG